MIHYIDENYTYTMLNHTELMEAWEKDCHIDKTDLMSTMYNHPMLHSKYLTHLQTYKVNLRKHVLKYATLKAVKIRYFCGEMTKEQLAARGWDQYLFKKPLRAEMEAILEADLDLQKIQEESIYLENLVQAVESIMKDVNSRYFLFKNLVEYEKFQSGL